MGVEKQKLTVNASKREEVPSARERASSLGSRKTPLEHCIKSVSKAGDAFIGNLTKGFQAMPSRGRNSYPKLLA